MFLKHSTRSTQQLPLNAGAEKNRLRRKCKNIFEKTGLLAHLPSSFLESVHAQEPGSSSSLLNQEVFITSFAPLNPGPIATNKSCQESTKQV